MKKILLIVTGFCICFSSFSQLLGPKKNEIKINAFTSFVEYYPEISYERFWGEHVGTGLSFGFPLKRDDINQYMVLPYARFYFLKYKVILNNRGWGTEGSLLYNCFFIEVNTGIFGTKEYNDTFTKEYNKVNLGNGFAIGNRVLRGVTEEDDPLWGVTCDVFFGVGIRNSKIVYPRIGISIGKTF